MKSNKVLCLVAILNQNKMGKKTWLYSVMYRFHKCKFENKLYDITMENNTNFLITQCKCGKTNMVRVHRESEMYKDWINL